MTKICKTCKTCKNSWDISLFYKSKLGRDGTNAICIKCDKERQKNYYNKGRERKDYLRAWQRNNKDKVAKYAKKWRENKKNLDKLKV